MRPRDQVKRELVGRWLAQADADLAVAGRLLPDGAPHAWAVAFHAQQAAEKFLKAFLAHCQIEFPKTHDLVQLLALVASKDRALAESLKETAALTPYGVEIRYPGEFPEVTASDAQQALELASAVREAVREALAPHAGEMPG
ncbi:MAG TPA: HEPN domain-containing protein [Phycisphaerae bacterium]|nr:HEPN domain-containing protein [Phycisphaerae bacterium]